MRLLSASLFLLLTIASPCLGQDVVVPDSAEAVKPLGVGDTIPRGIPIRSLDGTRMDLRELLDAMPSLLIFYRGGW